MSLSEKKRELYRKLLHKEIGCMEYINRRNELDKEFIKKLKEWTFISTNNEFAAFARAMNMVIDKLAGEDLK